MPTCRSREPSRDERSSARTSSPTTPNATSSTRARLASSCWRAPATRQGGRSATGRRPAPALPGSLYAALAHGTVDAEALRDLLARVPFAGAENEPPVYAVDVSVWDRCDAETSPERGFYYHPSRHSSGQPIVAGWAY